MFHYNLDFDLTEWNSLLFGLSLEDKTFTSWRLSNNLISHYQEGSYINETCIGLQLFTDRDFAAYYVPHTVHSHTIAIISSGCFPFLFQHFCHYIPSGKILVCMTLTRCEVAVQSYFLLDQRHGLVLVCSGTIRRVNIVVYEGFSAVCLSRILLEQDSNSKTSVHSF